MFDSLMASLSYGGMGIFVTGLALTFMLIGLIRMNSAWMVAAALFTVPYTYTHGDWSGILLVVRLLPLTQLVSAYLISQEDNLLAWVLAVPTLLALGYSFYDILMQQQAFQGFLQMP